MNLRAIAIHAATTALLVVPTLAFAQAGQLNNPIAADSITGFLGLVLDAVIAIAFPIIILFMVFIGFKFIAAQGNAEEIKKVRNLFFWAVVGALIVLGAKVLSLAICGTVNALDAKVVCH